MQLDEMTFADQKSRVVSGAIHFLTRMWPLLYEDKEFLNAAMWAPQSNFKEQMNATTILDSVVMLLFKPGFCVSPIPPDY